VLVIGAGPAGAAAAWSAARCGAHVLLVERCDWPRTKVCGSCVNPAGVAILARMNILQAATPDRATLSRLRLRTRAGSVTLALDAGIAVERAALDAALVGAAEQASAAFHSRSSAKVLARDGSGWRVRLGDRDVLARVVIACDGLTGASLGAVSDAERLGVLIDPSSWMGAGVVVPADRAARWCDVVAAGEIAMHIGDAGYVGLVRLADGRLDVAAALDAAHARSAGGPGPAIAGVLASCGVSHASTRLADEPISGTGLLTRRRSRPAAPGLIIAGDAAGYVEPFTGEGIAWALAQGEHAGALAARAARDPAAWLALAAEWSAWLRAQIDPRRRSCRALRWTLRHAPARRCTFAALSRSSLARAAAGAIVRATGRPYPTPAGPASEVLPCGS